MAGPKKTRPRGACSKAAGDESRRTTIQCTLATPHTHPARSLPTPSPALTPFRGSNGIFAYAACLPAASLPHVPCFSRSPLARPLPCVDRSFGERNPTCLRALLAQLMDLTTHCSDCAPARSSRSPLARPLPCVDRSIGERNLTCLRALPAQLMKLTTHSSVCAPARSSALPLHARFRMYTGPSVSATLPSPWHFQRSSWTWPHIVAIARLPTPSPSHTTSFPSIAHRRASSTFLR